MNLRVKLGGLMRVARFLGIDLINEISYLTARPFVQPKMAILYATFAGVLVSAGTGLTLDVFDAQGVRPVAPMHIAGGLFVATSVALSVVAWLMQSFGEHLSRTGKSDASIGEKMARFRTWEDRASRRLLRALPLVILLFFLSALYLLANPWTLPTS